MKILTFITCLKTTLFTKKPKNMYRSYEYNNFDIIVISSFPWQVCMFCTAMDCAYLDLWLWCILTAMGIKHMFEFYIYVTSRISHQICSYQHHKILHNPSSETKGTKKSLSDTYCSVLLLLPGCTWCAIGELSTQAMVCSCYLHYNQGLKSKLLCCF